MPNFTLTNLGTFVEIAGRKENDKLPSEKVFLKEKLGLTSCEISVNSAPKGTVAPISTDIIKMRRYTFFLKAQA